VVSRVFRQALPRIRLPDVIYDLELEPDSDKGTHEI